MLEPELEPELLLRFLSRERSLSLLRFRFSPRFQLRPLELEPLELELELLELELPLPEPLLRLPLLSLSPPLRLLLPLLPLPLLLLLLLLLLRLLPLLLPLLPLSPPRRPCAFASAASNIPQIINDSTTNQASIFLTMLSGFMFGLLWLTSPASQRREAKERESVRLMGALYLGLDKRQSIFGSAEVDLSSDQAIACVMRRRKLH